MTFNGHKLHYNEEWSQHVEGHPGLVVHGPLNLINLLNYWRDIHGKGQDPHEIKYRALSPIFSGETYHVRTGEIKETGNGRTWEVLADKDGTICMRGEIVSR